MKQAFHGYFNFTSCVIFLVVFSSCARISYFFEQGIGQLKIQNRAIANEELFISPTISKIHKNKIKQIINYKRYFYNFFGEKNTATYDKTIFLESSAIVYLVIGSRYDEIKPREECFMFVGCFPYLGFFKEDSAETYIQRLRLEGYVTWKRHVYAYSTLGYFDDPILSSFFYYEEYELAELIFHELFHTIFFVKNEVELNENLASYFGKEMSILYFQFDEKQRKELEEKNKKLDELSLTIVEEVKKLQRLYDLSKPLKKEEAFKILRQFLKESFIPEMENTCNKLQITKEDCYPLKKQWNNASFAAYLTYEKRKDEISQLRKSLKLDIKGFLRYLNMKYKEFEKMKLNFGFSEYLFKPVK